MRRNPGYASAIVLSLADDCTSFVGKRVRIVGQFNRANVLNCRVEEIVGSNLRMKQGDWTIIVRLNENYRNEHFSFQFLEVVGPLGSIENHVLYSTSFHADSLGPTRVDSRYAEFYDGLVL